MTAAAKIARLQTELRRQQRLLRQLADRQAIMDCAVRFSRGVNRLDRELLKSVFHPDAIDDHSFFVGNREQLVRWIEGVYRELEITQHFVTNQTVELDGDTAHAETYWLVANVTRDGGKVILRGGRYIDRLERRNGIWAISARVCLIEWNCGTEELQMPPAALALMAKTGIPRRDSQDPSYHRPLRIEREALLTGAPRAGGRRKRTP